MAVKRSKRAAAEKVPSAAKLKTLQETLNKNKRLRGKFIADPGAVLREQGVEIGEDKEKQIARYLWISRRRSATPSKRSSSASRSALGCASGSASTSASPSRTVGGSPWAGVLVRRPARVRQFWTGPLWARASYRRPMMPPEPRVQLRPADALVIVPPFAGLDRPSLGVHVLQACAKARGVTVSVLYANLLLGGEVGEPTYQAVCYGPSGALLGERFFAAAAFGIPPFGFDNAYVSYFSDRSDAAAGRSRDRPHRADAASAPPRRVARRRGRAGGRAECTRWWAVRRHSNRHRRASRCSAGSSTFGPTTRQSWAAPTAMARWPRASAASAMRSTTCSLARARTPSPRSWPRCWPAAGPANG